MKRKSERQRDFDPVRAKTFAQVLTHWLATEFPHLGGRRVRELFVQAVVALIQTHYITPQHLKPGQTLWLAVDKTDLPSDRRPMADTRLVPVILTLIADEDLEQLIRGASWVEVRAQRLARLLREADAQGGVLAETDGALLIGPNRRSVGDAIGAYERAHACVLPRRGTVHDMGPSVTHKRLIAHKAFLQAKQAPDVAWEAAHSLASAERYLRDLMRVYISLNRRAMSVEETAFATGLSRALVKEYETLIADLGLSDEQLPKILAQLEQTAHRRAAGSDPGSASS